MTRLMIKTIAVALLLTHASMVAWADDAAKQAVERDRQQLQGTWRVVSLVVNGNEAKQEDAQKLSVVNGADNTWSLRSEGNEISKGTNTLHPQQDPKAIDFTATEGGAAGQTHRGIYKLGEQQRTLCFAPAGKERPSTFASAPGSEHILVEFERVP